MTDYTIQTNFGAKDSLPSGNAAKVVKGSEFTTEFTNIATAVNSKADTAGDTFTGVVNFSADVAVNTNTLFVDVSENKVGIGTTSPYVKTEISSGDLAIGSGEGASVLGLEIKGVTLQAIPSAQVRGYIATGDSTIGVAGDLLIAPRTDVTASIRFITGTSPEERMRIDSSGNVGIGTTSPDSILDVVGADPILTIRDTSTAGADSHATLRLAESGASDTLNLHYDISLDEGNLTFNYDNTGSNPTERMRIDSYGNVGIGTDSPSAKLHIDNGATSEIITQVFGGGSIYSGVGVDGTGAILTAGSSGSANASMIFRTASNGAEAERMRIDASGNVLVGKTSGDNATAGLELNANGQLVGTFADGTHVLGRNSSDGNILAFIKDGSTVGAIASISGQYLSIGTGDTGLAFDDDENHIIPWNINTNGSTNGAVDLGDSARRFKDIYRSGSTYSTSDRNKKQDIRDLTDAEARVATVAKGSLKAFRYIDAVEAGGDDANIHFGIIAQDLKAAFEAEGLNADNYQVLKTSTYTDDDGVEQTTYSVCYENLLAFIISAI